MLSNHPLTESPTAIASGSTTLVTVYAHAGEAAWLKMWVAQSEAPAADSQPTHQWGLALGPNEIAVLSFVQGPVYMSATAGPDTDDTATSDPVRVVVTRDGN